MKPRSFFRSDLPNVIIALSVGFCSLVVYVLTRAATLSIWDCGELIAAGHVLGIPHPPGAPLYVLVARLFSLMPLASDVAVRINLLSSLSSAVTAAFCYLIAHRMLDRWFGEKQTNYGRLVSYAGAVCAALFVAFGLTQWTNSVEAEVYGLSMMMIAAMFWLGLIALESDGQDVTRIKLAIVFTSFLGIGVHMTTFLVFPVLALVLVVKRSAGNGVWYLLASFLALELYLIFALSSAPGEIPYYLPVGIVFLIYLFYIFSFDKIPRLFVWGGVGLALSILPVMTLLADAVARRNLGSGLDPAITAVLDTIGKTAFVGCCLFAAIAAFRTLGDKRRDAKKPVAVFAAFVGVAALMIGLLYLPKGYHAFVVTSAILGIGLAALIWRQIDWIVLLAVVAVGLVIVGVRPLLYGAAGGLIVIPLLGRLLKLSGWKAALMIIVVAIAGYSVHVFIPIRSAQQPRLNENNPSSSLRATEDFLERRQYGSMSMVERMFKRRAEWLHQFGNYQRMGFWRFFQDQYGLVGPRFIVLFLFGLFGVWELMRRNARHGLLLLLLIIVATVGLVLYMNFADGTRQDPRTGDGHIEVRDRDYFFTPGFIFFGLAIGLGITFTVYYLRDLLRSVAPAPQRVLSYVLLALLLLPAVPLARNFYYCDRSRNLIAFDYGWNFLQSTEPNAILFTFGDNDTFPLWCLQEVYGVRSDVAVINLMLANSKWYVSQVQTLMGVDLGWSESQIQSLAAFHVPDSASFADHGRRPDGSVFDYLGENRRISDSLLATVGYPYNTTFRYSDMLVDRIIYKYLGKRPICFSVSGASSSRRYLGHSIDNILTLRGMAWAVEPRVTGLGVDVEYCWDFLTDPERFRSRGVDDPSIYTGEAEDRLTANWANSFLMTADSLRAAGDMARSEQLAVMAVSRIPHASDATEFLAELWADQGRVDKLDSLVNATPAAKRPQLMRMLTEACLNSGDSTRAEQVQMSLLEMQPQDRTAFEFLVRRYYRDGRKAELQTVMQRWLQNNPGDAQVRSLLQDLQRGPESPLLQDTNSR